MLAQAKPNDTVLFKAISLEQAYTAALTTDAMVEAVTQLALGTTTAAAAEAQLAALKVSAACDNHQS